MLEANDVVTESAPKSDKVRRFVPLNLGLFTLLFKAGWWLSALIIALTIFAAVFVYKSNDNCIFTIADYPAVGATNTKSGRCITAERAITPEAQSQGLSDRDGLAANRGMLFVFDNPSRQCIWMKDMKFNLDVIWMDSSGKVVHTERDLSPSTYPNSYCPDKDVQYILELKSGVAKAAGIGIDSKANL